MEAHRGQILKDILKKYCDANGATLVFIAKQVGYDQSTLYKHFDREDLSFHIIRKYGKAISHDFSIEFPQMKDDYEYLTGSDEKNLPTNLKDSLEKIDYWRQKYIDLLEKHNLLLMEKLTDKS